MKPLQSPVNRPTNSPPRAGEDRVAIVGSSWHRQIVQQAATAILAEFDRQGWPASRIDSFDVPGAFEIPLVAQRLARSGRYRGIIATGLVVNGGIYSHEYVASAVINALMQVQTGTGVPVFSAVLTPRDFHAHEEHQRFFAAHFVTKGREVAAACLQTLALHERLDAELGPGAG